jgi:hypothetical protein
MAICNTLATDIPLTHVSTMFFCFLMAHIDGTTPSVSLMTSVLISEHNKDAAAVAMETQTPTLTMSTSTRTMVKETLADCHRPDSTHIRCSSAMVFLFSFFKEDVCSSSIWWMYGPQLSRIGCNFWHRTKTSFVLICIVGFWIRSIETMKPI